MGAVRGRRQRRDPSAAAPQPKTASAPGRTSYGNVLQWHFTEQPLEPHPLYVTWMRGDQRVAGLLPIGRGWNTPRRWQVLFQVDDLEASVAQVVDAGGVIEFGPLDVPRAGRLTSVRDPDGALHVLVQPRRAAT